MEDLRRLLPLTSQRALTVVMMRETLVQLGSLSRAADTGQQPVEGGGGGVRPADAPLRGEGGSDASQYLASGRVGAHSLDRVAQRLAIAWESCLLAALAAGTAAAASPEEFARRVEEEAGGAAEKLYRDASRLCTALLHRAADAPGKRGGTTGGSGGGAAAAAAQRGRSAAAAQPPPTLRLVLELREAFASPASRLKAALGAAAKGPPLAPEAERKALADAEREVCLHMLKSIPLLFPCRELSLLLEGRAAPQAAPKS